MSCHPLLARQLRRAFGSPEASPPELRPLFDQIDDAYRQFDQDRRITDCAMELSSRELTEANAWLLAQNQRNEKLLDRLSKTVSLLGTPVHANSDGDLLHIAEEIERLVAERQATEAALREAKEAADAANHAKSEFLANMSHEIRTPLNAVVGMTSILLDRELPPPEKEYVEIIRRSGEALLDIINDILDFSKIEAGQMEVELIPCDLFDTVEQVIDLFSVRTRESGLNLDVSFAPEVPACIVTDPTRLRQILINLVGNAIKFTSEGGVGISVATRPEGDALRIEFAIEDSGIGIPPERLNLLFKAFSQVDSSTARKYGGTGLGLAITRHLVGLLGGTIRVASRPGAGSTFSFDILATACRPGAACVPADQEKLPGECAPTPGDFAVRHPLRILVAEDVSVNRKVIDLHLRRLGYRCKLVADGQQAIHAVESEPFDVILMDMQMPGIDGLTATRRIRQQPGCERHPYIIALTANVFLEHRADAAQSGMQDYIAKPLRSEALTEALRNAHAWLLENPAPPPGQEPAIS